MLQIWMTFRTIVFLNLASQILGDKGTALKNTRKVILGQWGTLRCLRFYKRPSIFTRGLNYSLIAVKHGS